jgi:predicted metal-dependent hydrolase
MNHGPDFHRAVKAVLGRDPRADSAWLRAHGAALHRVGATEE